MKENFHFESVNGLAKALGGRIDLLEKIFGKKVRDNLKYSDIQKIVKSGFASEFFDLGDEIMTKYTATDGTVYDFPWRIVDFRDVYWENDSTPHPGMVLQSKYATLESIQFDAKEGTRIQSPEDTAEAGWYYCAMEKQSPYRLLRLNLNPGDTIPYDNYLYVYKSHTDFPDRAYGGDERYECSAIRQWLNSDAEAGGWWTEQHEGDTPPAQADTYNGFMHGFESDFISTIVPTQVITYTFNINRAPEITYDKFYPVGMPDMYGRFNPFNGYRLEYEISYFEYWKKVCGLEHRDNTANPNRIVYGLNDTSTSVDCFTRTANFDGGGTRFVLTTTGSFNSAAYSKDSKPVIPCCVIS